MMSNISMVEAKLSPGFRFHPRDDELVCDYLIKKIHNSPQLVLFIEVDLNKSEPWDIPETACVGGKQWYFYSQRDKKYATGLRTNRATATGYWKATEKDKHVLRKGTLVGMRKTLVFYQGRAPKGRKSNWVMNEFRLIQLPHPLLLPTEPSSHEEVWVLCRVFHKNREIVPKPSMETYNDDTISSNSYLPPLMDSSFIAFDQNTPSLFQQVPCFSSLITSSSQNINPFFTQVPYNNNNIMITKHNEAASSMIDGVLSSSSSARLDRSIIDCEEKSSVIDAVLNHLKKIENGNFDDMVKTSPSSSESYLSEVGMPNIWSNYYY